MDAEQYVKDTAKVHELAAEVARIISGMPQMPEFSSESLSGDRITYIISPRKIYEVTGHIWKGKKAL